MKIRMTQQKKIKSHCLKKKKKQNKEGFYTFFTDYNILGVYLLIQQLRILGLKSHKQYTNAYMIRVTYIYKIH